MLIHEPNTMAVIGLSILVGGHLLETLAILLNIKNLRKPLPEQMAALLEPDTWPLTQRYTLARHRLELLESTVGLLALVAFWFLGGFNQLNQWVTAWHLGPTATGVLYIGLLLFFSYGVTLPFTLYSTFGVETRFGFNRTTPTTFLTDQIKQFVLTLLLGGPLLAAVLMLFHEAGTDAWLYGWLGTAAFSLVMQIIVPRWILPLFNRFSPLTDGALRQAILAYAHTIHFPLAEIFEMDGSRRSSKANAFVSGFGKNRRIALFDTLIKNHTVDELVAVLAHEIGHARKRHIPKTLFLGILHLGVFFFLLSFFLSWPALYQGFFMEGTPIHAGFVFFGLLMGRIDLVFVVFLKKLSRRFEFEADRFAVETAPKPEALASALKTLAQGNLANLMPHPFYVMLHHSHPPLMERLAALAHHLETQRLQKHAP